MKGIKHILFGIGIVVSTISMAQPALPYPLDTIDGQVYYRYKVERSIGLYRISKNFGVSQEEILQANPQIQTTGLRYDEEIKIPVKGQNTLEKDTVQADYQDITKPKEKTSVVKKKLIVRQEVVQDTTVVDSIEIDSVVVTRDSSLIRLAVMLPLQAEAVKRDKNMDRFYDYYVGSLIAINEVQATGQAIEVFTYDIGKTAQKTNQLLNDSTWPKVDAIIGPAYTQQVTSASAFAKQDSTWLLVPFLSNVSAIENNPYLLQFNPSEKTEADTLARYLAQYGDSINCVLIEARQGDVIPSSIMALQQALKKHNVPTTTIPLAAILIDSLEGGFKKDVENIVIFNTEKFNNLQIVMPHLLKGVTDYRITLYSRYSWQNEKIILPQIYTSVFSDSISVTDTYTETFQQYFRHTLSSELPRYDLLGYDQTRHLLHLLQNNNLTDSAALQIWYGTQSNIQYQKSNLDGGYENQMIHIIRK